MKNNKVENYYKKLKIFKIKFINKLIKFNLNVNIKIQSAGQIMAELTNNVKFVLIGLDNYE